MPRCQILTSSQLRLHWPNVKSEHEEAEADTVRVVRTARASSDRGEREAIRAVWPVGGGGVYYGAENSYYSGVRQ